MIETVKESGGGIKSDANQLKAVSGCKIVKHRAVLSARVATSVSYKTTRAC